MNKVPKNTSKNLQNKVKNELVILIINSKLEKLVKHLEDLNEMKNLGLVKIKNISTNVIN
jgi:hypothetical protein